MKRAVIPLAVGALLVAGGPAAANSIDLLGVSGSWTEVTLQDGRTVTPDRVGSGSQLWLRGQTGNVILCGTPDHRYDTASYRAGYSGYYFYGAGQQDDLAVGQDISLGDFYHVNQPIKDDSASILSAVLDLVFEFSIDGSVMTLTNQYRFAHDETPNEAATCANGDANRSGVNDYGCADHVTVTLNRETAQTVALGGRDYSFLISGFMRDGTLADDFWTREFHSNKASLFTRFDVLPTPVPLPASGLLLAAGIAGLGAGRRLRQPARGEVSS